MKYAFLLKAETREELEALKQEYSILEAKQIILGENKEVSPLPVCFKFEIDGKVFEAEAGFIRQEYLDYLDWIEDDRC